MSTEIVEGGDQVQTLDARCQALLFAIIIAATIAVKTGHHHYMAKPTDIQLKQAVLSQERIEFRTPLKFGGREVTDVVLGNVDVVVETRDGRTGKGRGSMPMANVWSWPSQAGNGDQALAAMLGFAGSVVSAASDYDGQRHPLEMTHDLAAGHAEIARRLFTELDFPEPLPRLAQLVAASPLEAAIYDAYGHALGENAYNLLGADFVNDDLSAYLTAEFAGEYLDRYTSRRPKPTLPLYHLVGALDPLTYGDVGTPVGDDLPETLGEWIEADGLTHLKIKLAGDDLAWDVERVVAVENVTAETQGARGCDAWYYSLDFNEKCADVQYVLDFLARIEERSPVALRRVQYIEQPTHRDLRANPENRMHEAARIKPVVIDESLVDFESLVLAREQGYSGIALKACKGHSEALLMGAAAQKYNLFLCVQDLTCVGISFLHSASIAARIPTVAAIEGNGRQYCPAGNRGWDKQYRGMFEVSDGTVATGELNGPGLGF